MRWKTLSAYRPHGSCHMDMRPCKFPYIAKRFVVVSIYFFHIDHLCSHGRAPLSIHCAAIPFEQISALYSIRRRLVDLTR